MRYGNRGIGDGGWLLGVMPAIEAGRINGPRALWRGLEGWPRRRHRHYVLDLVYREVQDAGPYRCAEEDHVGGTGDGGILGQLLYIEADYMRQGGKGLTKFVDIGVVGNIDEGDAGGNDPAIGSEIGDVAQGFHRLHGDDDIGGATGDEVAGDRVAGDAQVGLNIASALTHAVHLGLLDIEILVHGCLANDGCDGEDALSAHTAQYYILFHDLIVFK